MPYTREDDKRRDDVTAGMKQMAELIYWALWTKILN